MRVAKVLSQASSEESGCGPYAVSHDSESLFLHKTPAQIPRSTLGMTPYLSCNNSSLTVTRAAVYFSIDAVEGTGRHPPRVRPLA